MSQIIPVNGLFGEAKSVLRFYDDSQKRNEYIWLCKKNVGIDGIDCTFKLYVPNDRLIPFHILRPYLSSVPASFKIYTDEGVEVAALSTSLLSTRDYDETSVIIYKGDDTTILLSCGEPYYIQITDDTGATYFSERFWATQYNKGADLITNGDFTNGLTGWRGTYDTITDGHPCGSIDLTQDAMNEQNVLWECKVSILNGALDNQIYVMFGENGDLSKAVPFDSNTFVATGRNPGSNFDSLQIFTGVGTTACIGNIQLRKIELTYDKCFPRLKWWNTCGNVGSFYYGADGTAYYNEILLDPLVELEELDPKYDVEGVQNGFKNFIPMVQQLTSKYKMKVGYVPRFIVDALAQIQLHDSIQLIMPNNLGSSMIEDVSMKTEWEDQGVGCFANVTIDYSLPEKTLTTGCCDDDFLSVCTEGCDPEFNDWIDHIATPIQAGIYLNDKSDDWTIIGNTANVDHSDPGDSFIEWEIPVTPYTAYAFTYIQALTQGGLTINFDPSVVNSYDPVTGTTTAFIYSGAETSIVIRITADIESLGSFTFSIKVYTGCWDLGFVFDPTGEGQVIFNSLNGGITFPDQYGVVILDTTIGLLSNSTHVITIDVGALPINGVFNVWVHSYEIYVISAPGVYEIEFDSRIIPIIPLPALLNFSVFITQDPDNLGTGEINSINIRSCTYEST